MVFAGYAARKCRTDSAIELTCPGVPVTACATMRPSGRKTPADRSPASRVAAPKAVRMSVCACSSTTEIRRFHMTCIWIVASAPADERAIESAPSFFQHHVIQRIHVRIEIGRYDDRGLIFDDQRRTFDRRARRKLSTLVNRHVAPFRLRHFENTAFAVRARQLTFR